MESPIIIDINCDLGEGSSIADCDKDALLMPFISSCNIACGGHAGNELTIRQSLLNAGKHQLKVGAHPGYPDPENFGRSTMDLTSSQLEKILCQQIGLCLDIAGQEQISLKHIKLHGALYNDVEQHPGLAKQIAGLIAQYYPSLKISGLAGGELENACNTIGLEFIAEGFMDRAYLSNGKLAPRSLTGAVIHDRQTCINQAITLASNQPIKTIDGKIISPKVKTICLHGDNPSAIDIIRDLTLAFKDKGIVIQ